MNGPALLGILAAVGILAVIYSASDHGSPWPRISFLIAGAIGILALDLPWQATVSIFAFIGVGWIVMRAFNRRATGAFPWEFSAHQAKRSLGEDWESRYGGDGASDNWGRRHAEAEARYGADDRADDRAGGRQRGSRSIDRDEALRVLGLDDVATDRDVKRAHRRLMKKHHPDRGGSTEIAARLNRAREQLLQH